MTAEDYLNKDTSITKEGMLHCQHGVNIEEYTCSICAATQEVATLEKIATDNQLSLIEAEATTIVTVPVAPMVTKPKGTLTETQKTDILRQGLEHVAGFNGDIWAAPLTKPKTYMLQGDGLWCIADKLYARMILKISDNKFIGEYTVLENAFNYKLARIPGSFLTQILAFFRHYVIDEGITSVTEAMTQIYWDPIDSEYFIHIPKQEVSGARVAYLFTDADPRIKAHRCHKVWDIHSHNTMSSFFSGVDDADEQGQQFYGVIGNITADSHTWKFRMGIDGHWAGINADDPNDSIHALFDMSSFTEVGTYPTEWKDRVSMTGFNNNAIIVTGANNDWKKQYGDYYGGGHGYGRYDYENDDAGWEQWRRDHSGSGYQAPTYKSSWDRSVKEKIDDMLILIKEGTDIRHLAAKIVADPYADKILQAIYFAAKVNKAKKKGK